MHVAHFIQRYPPAIGGSEAYFARLTTYLQQNGHKVTVWTTTAKTLEELWHPVMNGYSHEPDVRRYPTRSIPFRRYVLKALSLIPHRPWQLITQPCNPICPEMWRDAGNYSGPLDAVHATAFPYGFPLMCGLRLARRRKVPFLLTPFLHYGDVSNPQDRTRKQYTSAHLVWMLKQANRIFVQTKMEFDAVVKCGIAPKNIVLQGLGVDASECKGGDRDFARNQWNVRGEVVIGHLANLSEEKGSVDLLRAASLLWEEGVKFRVVLAGPTMKNFRHFWEKYKYQDRVVLLGTLSEIGKRDFFAGLDVFSLPSRTDSFGLVLLEAWANAKPVVVYRAGGPAEIVQHEQDGLQARCGDLPDLARQLQMLIQDEIKRTQFGASGEARTRTEFQWQDKLEIVQREMMLM
jgi:glycosyltransferase involved in cell wall biosynthesis